MTIDQISSRLDSIDSRLSDIEKLMHGEQGALGVSGKIAVMWKSYVWILCTMSGAAGSLFTFIALKLTEVF